MNSGLCELRVLKLTCVSEEIRITTQPEKYVTVKEGQQLLVSTEASGFPYPRYMWHRFDPKLDESVATAFTQSTLKINQARYVHFFFLLLRQELLVTHKKSFLSSVQNAFLLAPPHPPHPPP